MMLNQPKTPSEELDDIYFEKELHRILKEGLSEREYQVIYSRFWDELTLEETGKVIRVSRERVRQIEAKALRKLRHPSRQGEFMKLGGLFAFFARKWKQLWDEPPKPVVVRHKSITVQTPKIETVIAYEIDPNGPKPEWVIVERWSPDSQPYLALRVGDVGRMPPLTLEQYNRWLEQALKEEQDALCYRS